MCTFVTHSLHCLCLLCVQLNSATEASDALHFIEPSSGGLEGEEDIMDRKKEEEEEEMSKQV